MMIVFIAKWIVILFGIFLIASGFLMLLSPEKARATLRKAGSTNFINYAELIIRMIPAAGLIIYSEFSRFPVPLKVLGWFMLITSIILCIIPRKLHHSFSLKAADILKPVYFRFISPLSFLFGSVIIYSVL
jgi:preprotein translocase subunit SecG